MMRTLVLAAVATALLGACATVPAIRYEARVGDLIDAVNTGPAEAVVALSAVPFLFGGEVLWTESDLEAVLSRLLESGLRLGPGVDSIRPLSGVPEGARLAVTTFYDRLPRDARAVEIQSNAGTVTLVTGGRRGRLPVLYGIVRGSL